MINTLSAADLEIVLNEVVPQSTRDAASAIEHDDVLET